VAKGYLQTQVSVAPTTTTMVTLDVRDTDMAAVAVKNLDGSQTLSVTVSSRIHPALDWAPSTLADLSSIPAGATRSVQVDTRRLDALLLEGVASGAGLTAEVTARADS
jgi:hypothetical protein